MNSRIIDEDYLHSELLKSYDKIIGSSMEYMYELSSQNDNKIVLRHFNYKDDEYKYLYRIACLCNTVVTFPIYLDLPYFKYRKLIKELKPTYEVHRYNKFKAVSISPKLLKYTIKSKYKDVYTDNILIDIYNEYWKEKEEDKEEENEMEMD